MGEDLVVLIRRAAEDPEHVPDFVGLAMAGRRRRRLVRAAVASVAVMTVAVAGLVTTAVWRPSGLPVIGDPPESSAPVGPAGWSEIPAGPLSPRNAPVGVWSGTELLVAGGSSMPACPAGASCALGPQPLVDGAAFDPATGMWRSIADAPVAFAGGDAVMVNSRMFVLTVVDTARVLLAYDIAADTWEQLPAPTVPAARLFAAGDRLYAYVADASTQDRKAVKFPDVQFDPARRVWEPLPLDPLDSTGSRQLLWLDGTTVLIGQTRPEDGLVRLSAARLAEDGWQPLGAIDLNDLPQDWAAAHDIAVAAFTPSPDGNSPAGLVFDGVDFALLPEAPSWWDEHPGLPVAGNRFVVTDRGVLDSNTRAWAPLNRPGKLADDGAVTVWASGRLLTWGGTNHGQVDQASGETGLVTTAWQYIPKTAATSRPSGAGEATGIPWTTGTLRAPEPDEQFWSIDLDWPVSELDPALDLAGPDPANLDLELERAIMTCYDGTPITEADLRTGERVQLTATLRYDTNPPRLAVERLEADCRALPPDEDALIIEGEAATD